MNKIVLDASALLAILNAEPGSDKLTPGLLTISACSTVNLAEVQGRLVNRGIRPDRAWAIALSPVAESVPFTVAHARVAGRLISDTRALGLSLGDRACLALALDLQAPVYTADKSWKNLRLGLKIHLIR